MYVYKDGSIGAIKEARTLGLVGECVMDKAGFCSHGTPEDVECLICKQDKADLKDTMMLLNDPAEELVEVCQTQKYRIADLETQRAALKAQLAEADKDCTNWRHNFFVERKRLAEAEGFIRTEVAGGTCSDCELENGECVHQRARAFLANADTDYVVVRKIDIDGLIAAEDNLHDYAVVLRDDLEIALDALSVLNPEGITYDRLKAASKEVGDEQKETGDR